LGISRRILEVLLEFNHPVRIVTKSTGILRDLDLLSKLASRDLVAVNMSICTLDEDLCRKLEPRAASSGARLRCVEKLSKAGVPAGVIVAPIIPVLNDSHLERVLESSRSAGALFAHYIFIRLPLEVSPLFREWLELHYPLKATHIMNRIQDSSQGKDYQSEFGKRMRGQGVFAELIAQRFKSRYEQLEFPGDVELKTDLFRPPGVPEQLGLF
jgi:DNA repair photolyase